MKSLANRAVLVTVIMASLTLGTSAVASAHDSLNALTPLQAFQAAQRQYNHDLFVINQKFNLAIVQDQAVETAALSAAQSPAQKYLARIDFNEARALDVANWEADLKKLGNPPQLWMFTQPTGTTTTTAPLL